MNELDTRDRRGAHRMQRGPVQALVPGLLAVAAVAALVVAVLVVRGTAPSTTSTAAAGATSTARATTPPSPTGSSSAPAPSSSADPTGSPVPTGTASASATPAATDTPDGAGGVKSGVSVVVLNQTRISGLAGQVAQTLRAAGWTVSATGNFAGSVPSTTVYYPEGMQAAAEALAADLPGPDRVRPRFGNLAKDKLTVIVTRAAG